MGGSEDGPGRVAIIGSGGIGSYLAFALGEAGRDVTMCVRTPFDRLVVESGGATHEVAVPLATDPGEVGPVRWVLLTVKAQDTAGAKPWLHALAGPGTVLAVVQNGIEHAERARPVSGAVPLLPAVIYCSVERDRPGHVVHHGAAKLVVPNGPEAQAFAALFAGTRFEVELSADFKTAAWRKLFGNLVANPVTALTLRRGEAMTDPAIRDLARAVLTEALRVAQADDAGLTEADLEASLAGMGRLGRRSGSSMLYDRLAGRPLEHEALTGALVRLADRHAIPVPANRTLLSLLRAVSGRPLPGPTSA